MWLVSSLSSHTTANAHNDDDHKEDREDYNQSNNPAS